MWSALGRHRLFAVAFGAGLVIRVITMLAFPPAIWFGGDSASYVSAGLRLIPGASRLSGYGLMLRALEPFHSFAVVTAVQHLMGLAVAVMLYALLRRYGLPGWGATLATLPVLFEAYQLELEHEILPSAPFEFLIVTGITLVLWWRGKRPVWATAAAGLIFAGAGTFWPVGMPILILYLLYLVVRRVGWQAFVATVAAGAVPIAGYLLWFDITYHQVAFTNSDGIFLWSRTMTFANCAVIKPPAAELPLCAHQPVGDRPPSPAFIWDKNSPLSNVPGTRFSPETNALALDFALRAIRAQPLSYAGTVLRAFSLTFHWGIPNYPSEHELRRYQFAYATEHWISPQFQIAPGHTVASDELVYGRAASTRAVEPFAGWMRGYQRFVYLPGTLLGLGMLIGLGGIIRFLRGGGYRRLTGWGGPGLFPWAAGLALLLVPVMTADFSKRYTLIAVPVVFLAAGLAFARRDEATRAEPAPGAVQESVPSPRTLWCPA